MLTTLKKEKFAPEGYVYVSYGHTKYLKHTLASVVSLRRYDRHRPVALVCTEKHKRLIQEKGLENYFDIIYPLPEEHASIVGFKHNIYHYMFFEKNMYLDSDIIWCKNPNPLWSAFSDFDFTITGTLISDNYFGAPKSAGVIKDIILRRRSRTLKRFGLTYLSRVQSGMMFASDYDLTKKVCKTASEMLSRKHETHFQSRKMEQGRTEESCEWSLAMAMSKLNIPVYPWLQGHNSPQLDFIADLTEFDPDFEYVACKFYSDKFVYSFRGLKSTWKRKLFIWFFSLIPGKGDYIITTPYSVHFGWYHQKQPFYSFAEKVWYKLTNSSGTERISNSEDNASNEAL